jgi:type I restriction enzyme S subunit
VAGATASAALRDSEVGAIPAHWEVVPLGDLLVLSQYGLSIRGERSGAVPILRMNCQQDGRVVFRNLQFVDLEARVLDGYRLHDGDLLFNRTNSYELVGRTALFEGEREAVFASYLVRLRADRSRVHPAFLSLFLNLPVTQERLKGLATRGVSQSNISASKLKTLSVVLPPLDEQRQIAETLGAVQLAQVVENERVERLKALKAATMTKLFREGLRGEPQLETQIGLVPKTWIPRRLDELADLLSGGTPSKARVDWWSGAIPWLSPKDMKRTWIGDTDDHVTEEAARSGSRIVGANTVFVVIRGMILAKDVPVCIATVPMAFNQDVKAIVPKAGVDPSCLLYAVQASKQRLASEIGTSAHGTRRLGSSSLESLLVPWPLDAKEAEEVGQAVRCLDEAVDAAGRRLSTLREFFAAALWDLMTGRVRVGAPGDA